jgi:hypothetical protein
MTKKIKTFVVPYTQRTYGYIEIQATSIDDALENLEYGEFLEQGIEFEAHTGDTREKI